eukprot:8271812-Pyramimonas_sp.AAC.1
MANTSNFASTWACARVNGSPLASTSCMCSMIIRDGLPPCCSRRFTPSHVALLLLRSLAL